MRKASQVAVFVGALLVCSGGAAGVAVVAGLTAPEPPPPAASHRPLNVARPRPAASALAPASDTTTAHTAPVAVMIDNWIEARPQFGLDRADVVYELLVEGGITRFLAVYDEGQADQIGPVRSARTPFLPLALEWGAVYLHVGAAAEAGPADAARQLRDWRVRAVDEEGHETVIRRLPGRVAPHNAFTDTAAARALARTRGWGANDAPPWPRKADGGTVGTTATTLDYDFDRDGAGGGAFAVRWQYDASANRYRRFQGGAPQHDGRSGEHLTATNVIVQLAEARPAGDRAGHVLYQTEGTGRALVLLDGKALAATWRKDSLTARTRFLDEQGRDIALNHGPTWIALLPSGAPLALR